MVVGAAAAVVVEGVGAVRVVLPGSAVGLYFVPIVLAVSLLLLLLLLLFQLSLFFIFSVYDPFVQSWCIFMAGVLVVSAARAGGDGA